KIKVSWIDKHGVHVDAIRYIRIRQRRAISIEQIMRALNEIATVAAIPRGRVLHIPIGLFANRGLLNNIVRDPDLQTRAESLIGNSRAPTESRGTGERGAVVKRVVVNVHHAVSIRRLVEASRNCDT